MSAEMSGFSRTTRYSLFCGDGHFNKLGIQNFKEQQNMQGMEGSGIIRQPKSSERLRNTRSHVFLQLTRKSVSTKMPWHAVECRCLERNPLRLSQVPCMASSAHEG
jgi:hypothetical protein